MVGPTEYLIRADSATVASVWSRNTITKRSAADDASAAMGGRSPSSDSLLRMTRAIARAPTSSGASAIRPCVARVIVNIATTTAAAAGHTRYVATAYST